VCSSDLWIVVASNAASRMVLKMYFMVKPPSCKLSRATIKSQIRR
jgi:hypothetical protein